MSEKIHVYISADYSEDDGDREVVDQLNKWGADDYHLLNFADLAAVASGSVSKTNDDCRPCDLKAEFNRQINKSSVVIIVIGNKTKDRTAGRNCSRNEKAQGDCTCTPYKKNVNGAQPCKVPFTWKTADDVGNINSYSYLRHEFEQAKKKAKTIVIFYNSLNKQTGWLPSYIDKTYGDAAEPFWTRDANGKKVGNYKLLKEKLGL